MHGDRRRRSLRPLVLASLLILAGCSGPQSALDPAGPSAASIDLLGRIMYVGATLAQRCRRRIAGGLRQPGEPRIELRPRHGNDVERHKRVLETAIFGTLAAIDAGSVDLDHHAVDPAGDHVGLASKARDPEAVNHVVRAQEEFNGLADRQPQLVR